jgi:hypothetical protein
MAYVTVSPPALLGARKNKANHNRDSTRNQAGDDKTQISGSYDSVRC